MQYVHNHNAYMIEISSHLYLNFVYTFRIFSIYVDIYFSQANDFFTCSVNLAVKQSYHINDMFLIPRKFLKV